MKRVTDLFKWRIEDTFRMIGLAIFVLIFYFFYSRQENERTKLLGECSFFTIMTPDGIRKKILHYHYYYNGKREEGMTPMDALKLDFFYDTKKIVSSRHWLQVHCNDFNPKRVRWEFVVPDTLWTIPDKGWNKIPYGLDKLE